MGRDRSPEQDGAVSERRPVTLITVTDEGEMVIEAVLDDGYADADGTALDPGWLASAARGWLERGGALRDRSLSVQARATDAWQSGRTTMIRARVVSSTVKGMLLAGVPLRVLLGIASPVIERADYEPVTRITGGRLDAGLEGVPREPEDRQRGAG
jgi:hypothetical protein